MAFDDTFRLSSHAVITNADLAVLMVKANYGDRAWGLPGGALEPGETIHEALARECLEELGCQVTIKQLTGVYYHSAFNSQAFIFRCELSDDAIIQLSSEHTDYEFQAISRLSAVQQRRIYDCLAFTGTVVSAKF
ncbi:NUDIX domain-containing protein [Shewanella sp. SNU WT4]|uniref:NUDIX hydrolase n=1 Tax=Shewanella sp. SNU WT4 TaxID=2590015 RepID=UPI00112A92A9|nr:NUDIX domain-containing protein [Shewanella sp. SNU WT4]QDF68557.1 NUDIX domain-containing protein [Shewanella sp. SNU WT4]